MEGVRKQICIRRYNSFVLFLAIWALVIFYCIRSLPSTVLARSLHCDVLRDVILLFLFFFFFHSPFFWAPLLLAALLFVHRSLFFFFVW